MQHFHSRDLTRSTKPSTTMSDLLSQVQSWISKAVYPDLTTRTVVDVLARNASVGKQSWIRLSHDLDIIHRLPSLANTQQPNKKQRLGKRLTYEPHAPDRNTQLYFDKLPKVLPASAAELQAYFGANKVVPVTVYRELELYKGWEVFVEQACILTNDTEACAALSNWLLSFAQSSIGTSRHGVNGMIKILDISLGVL